MKISTKGTYGLKAMVDLAVYSVNDSVTLKSISERQNISERYLEQIFSALRKSGIIKGRKGTRGGYTITKSIADITVGEILRALEGDLFEVSINDQESNKIDKCLSNKVWSKLGESIDSVVDSITLEDLVVEYNKEEQMNFVYYI